MIVIGWIGIGILMVIETMEDLGIETMTEIEIVTGVMIEIATGTTIIKTRQDTAESGVGRGATQTTITVMKLYTYSLFFLHDFKFMIEIHVNLFWIFLLQFLIYQCLGI